jgi:hypothetical protein
VVLWHVPGEATDQNSANIPPLEELELDLSSHPDLVMLVDLEGRPQQRHHLSR